MQSLPIFGWKMFFEFFHKNYNETNFGFVAHVLPLRHDYKISGIRKLDDKNYYLQFVFNELSYPEKYRYPKEYVTQ